MEAVTSSCEKSSFIHEWLIDQASHLEDVRTEYLQLRGGYKQRTFGPELFVGEIVEQKEPVAPTFSGDLSNLMSESHANTMDDSFQHWKRSSDDSNPLLPFKRSSGNSIGRSSKVENVAQLFKDASAASMQREIHGSFSTDRSLNTSLGRSSKVENVGRLFRQYNGDEMMVCDPQAQPLSRSLSKMKKVSNVSALSKDASVGDFVKTTVLV